MKEEDLDRIEPQSMKIQRGKRNVAAFPKSKNQLKHIKKNCLPEYVLLKTRTPHPNPRPTPILPPPTPPKASLSTFCSTKTDRRENHLCLRPPPRRNKKEKEKGRGKEKGGGGENDALPTPKNPRLGHFFPLEKRKEKKRKQAMKVIL